MDRHAGQHDPAAIGSCVDVADARSGDEAFAKLDADMRFQGLVLEDGECGLGLAELRTVDEIANELGAVSIDTRSVFSTRSYSQGSSRSTPYAT